MRSLRLLLALAVALLLAPRPAAAFGFYLVGAIGEATGDTTFGRSFRQVIDGEDDSWAAGLGLQLGRRLALQLEYHDLGAPSGSGSICPDRVDNCLALVAPVEADTTALSLTVLPHLRLTRRLAIFAKLGVVSWESDVSAVIDRAESFIDDFDDEELLYGLGLRAHLVGPLGGFVQYQRFGDVFDEVAVGATLGFD